MAGGEIPGCGTGAYPDLLSAGKPMIFIFFGGSHLHSGNTGVVVVGFSGFPGADAYFLRGIRLIRGIRTSFP